MARLPRSTPVDGRIRTALAEEAELIQGYMNRVGAGDYGRFASLRAGGTVSVEWWELPDFVKGSMPRPHDVQELWTLGTDDVLGRS